METSLNFLTEEIVVSCSCLFSEWLTCEGTISLFLSAGTQWTQWRGQGGSGSPLPIVLVCPVWLRAVSQSVRQRNLWRFDCLHICLSVDLYLSVCLCLSVCVYFIILLAVCLSIPVCVSVYMFLSFLYVSMFICLSQICFFVSLENLDFFFNLLNLAHYHQIYWGKNTRRVDISADIAFVRLLNFRFLIFDNNSLLCVI